MKNIQSLYKRKRQKLSVKPYVTDGFAEIKLAGKTTTLKNSQKTDLGIIEKNLNYLRNSMYSEPPSKTRQFEPKTSMRLNENCLRKYLEGGPLPPHPQQLLSSYYCDEQLTQTWGNFDDFYHKLLECFDRNYEMTEDEQTYEICCKPCQNQARPPKPRAPPAESPPVVNEEPKPAKRRPEKRAPFHSKPKWLQAQEQISKIRQAEQERLRKEAEFEAANKKRESIAKFKRLVEKNRELINRRSRQSRPAMDAAPGGPLYQVPHRSRSPPTAEQPVIPQMAKIPTIVETKPSDMALKKTLKREQGLKIPSNARGKYKKTSTLKRKSNKHDAVDRPVSSVTLRNLRKPESATTKKKERIQKESTPKRRQSFKKENEMLNDKLPREKTAQEKDAVSVSFGSISSNYSRVERISSLKEEVVRKAPTSNIPSRMSSLSASQATLIPPKISAQRHQWLEKLDRGSQKESNLLKVPAAAKQSSAHPEMEKRQKGDTFSEPFGELLKDLEIPELHPQLQSTHSLRQPAEIEIEIVTKEDRRASAQSHVSYVEPVAMVIKDKKLPKTPAKVPPNKSSLAKPDVKDKKLPKTPEKLPPNKSSLAKPDSGASSSKISTANKSTSEELSRTESKILRQISQKKSTTVDYKPKDLVPFLPSGETRQIQKRKPESKSKDPSDEPFPSLKPKAVPSNFISQKRHIINIPAPSAIYARHSNSIRKGHQKSTTSFLKAPRMLTTSEKAVEANIQMERRSSKFKLRRFKSYLVKSKPDTKILNRSGSKRSIAYLRSVDSMDYVNPPKSKADKKSITSEDRTSELDKKRGTVISVTDILSTSEIEPYFKKKAKADELQADEDDNIFKTTELMEYPKVRIEEFELSILSEEQKAEAAEKPAVPANEVAVKIPRKPIKTVSSETAQAIQKPPMSKASKYTNTESLLRKRSQISLQKISKEIHEEELRAKQHSDSAFMESYIRRRASVEAKIKELMKIVPQRELPRKRAKRDFEVEVQSQPIKPTTPSLGPKRKPKYATTGTSFPNKYASMERRLWTPKTLDEAFNPNECCYPLLEPMRMPVRRYKLPDIKTCSKTALKKTKETPTKHEQIDERCTRDTSITGDGKCSLCDFMCSRHQEEDTPLIKEMKEKLRKVELRAYYLNMCKREAQVQHQQFSDCGFKECGMSCV